MDFCALLRAPLNLPFSRGRNLYLFIYSISEYKTSRFYWVSTSTRPHLSCKHIELLLKTARRAKVVSAGRFPRMHRLYSLWLRVFWAGIFSNKLLLLIIIPKWFFMYQCKKKLLGLDMYISATRDCYTGTMGCTVRYMTTFYHIFTKIMSPGPERWEGRGGGCAFSTR
jgi:hypothetical protein